MKALKTIHHHLGTIGIVELSILWAIIIVLFLFGYLPWYAALFWAVFFYGFCWSEQSKLVREKEETKELLSLRRENAQLKRDIWGRENLCGRCGAIKDGINHSKILCIKGDVK